MTERQGKNWDLELSPALWAYRTAIKTGTGFTPFHLVYGKEALLPIEVEIPAVRMMEKFLEGPKDAFKERLLCLQEAQLCRDKALEHYEEMQEKMLKRVNKKVRSKGIVEKDLVLRYNTRLDNSLQKKFQVKWEGPFMVMQVFPNGTYQLADLDGTLHASRVNGYRLKKYYARLMVMVQDAVTEDMLSDEGEPSSVDMGFDLNMLFTARP